jgi:hypothetical protein
MFNFFLNPKFEKLFHLNQAEGFTQFWNLPALRAVTRRRTSDVCRVTLPGSDVTAYLKRYWYPSLYDRSKGFFRNTFFGMSRAAREYRSLSRLCAARCSRVRPIAYGEERTLRLLKRAFIITEELPGSITLEDLCRSASFDAWPSRRRRRLFAALGNWVRTFHDRGFRDGDLFSRNIVVHEKGEDFAFSKIDSPAGSGGGKPPGSGSVFPRDIVDLDADTAGTVNEPDRLRFLLAYLAESGVNSAVRFFLTRTMTRREKEPGKE